MVINFKVKRRATHLSILGQDVDVVGGPQVSRLSSSSCLSWDPSTCAPNISNFFHQSALVTTVYAAVFLYYSIIALHIYTKVLQKTHVKTHNFPFYPVIFYRIFNLMQY